jgi:hypothetical protein
VLPAAHRFHLWLMKRYGVGVEASLEFFDNADAILRAKLTDPEFPRHLARARTALAVDTHIHRLIAFYRSVAAEG